MRDKPVLRILAQKALDDVFSESGAHRDIRRRKFIVIKQA